jgi:hypothetical protein
MIKTFSIIALFFMCMPVWSAPPDIYFSVVRQRAVDEIEHWHAQISFHFNLADLSEGGDSIAVLSGPFPGKSVTLPVAVRANRGIFSFRVKVSGLDDLLGDWSCVINDGDAFGERMHFTISGLNDGHVPEYTGFPQLNYQSNYQEVFVPGPGSNISVSVSNVGYSQQKSVHNGTVYTFPDGGPYFASVSRTGSESGFPVTDELGNHIQFVQFIELRSVNRIDFQIAPDSPPLSMAIVPGSQSIEIFSQGLTVGEFFTLMTSEDLVSWQTAAEFTSRSNLYIHTADSSTDRVRFYKVLQD